MAEKEPDVLYEELKDQIQKLLTFRDNYFLIVSEDRFGDKDAVIEQKCQVCFVLFCLSLFFNCLLGNSAHSQPNSFKYSNQMEKQVLLFKGFSLEHQGRL